MRRAKAPPVSLPDRSSPSPISDVIDAAYTRYSVAIMCSRAIPDARDGLKPVQRRVLYAMSKLGLGPSGGFAKSAKVCGQTSGDLHPHGESVIYPTLVRMAQHWVMRAPLVEPQGNFGNVDGDSPAAMRYTEVKLSYHGEAVVDDVDGDSVDFVPNYTGKLLEPTVLPSLLPNLLCNGGSGIAVGVACSFLPHNLGEVSALVEAFIDDPQLSLDRAMEIMPGPDFPTGGRLRGQSGVRQYYESGRGSVILDGVWTVSTTAKGCPRVEVTELPYMSSPKRLVEQIAQMASSKQIEIADLKDLSSRRAGEMPVRVVIELPKGGDVDHLMAKLLKGTCLRAPVAVNHTVVMGDRVVEGAGILDLVREYVAHRLSVTRRRLSADVIRAEARLHILAGMISARERIREAVDIICDADSPAAARERLLLEGIVATEAQAEAVLDTSLRRLTRLEVDALRSEMEALEKALAVKKKMLASDKLMLASVNRELRTYADKHGDARRTTVAPEAEEIASSTLIRREEVIVSVSGDGYVKREPDKGQPGDGYRLTTHDSILFFTDRGLVYRKHVHEIPEPARGSRGQFIAQLVAMRPGEKFVASVPVQAQTSQHQLLLVSRAGFAKRCKLEDFSSLPAGKQAVATKFSYDGDELGFVLPISGPEDMMVCTSRARAVRYPVQVVRLAGRTAVGVRSIKPRPGDSVVSVILMDRSSDVDVLAVTSRGYASVANSMSFRILSGTNAPGRQLIASVEPSRNGEVVSVTTLGVSPILVTDEGRELPVELKPLRKQSKSAHGLRVVELERGEAVCAVLQQT